MICPQSGRSRTTHFPPSVRCVRLHATSWRQTRESSWLRQLRERRCLRSNAAMAAALPTVTLPACGKGAAVPSVVDAEPYVFTFERARVALLIIDMQRDFLEAGGFGEMLGNDISLLRRTVEPNRQLLAAWRSAGLLAIHTREGHRPDLADLP